MVERHDAEGFGSCTNYYECEAACPKEISVKHIALLNRRLRSQDALAMVNLGWRLDARTAESVGLVWRVVDRAEHREVVSELLALASQDAALSRRVRQSISLEVDADAVTDRGVEIERGSQMWSLGRRGDDGWKR